MNKSLVLALPFMALFGSAGISAQDASLSYYGRSTVKIVTAKKFVIYIDPFADGDYSLKADLVLVTHGHSDHNEVSLVALNAGAIVAAPSGAVSAPGYRAVKEGDSFAVGPATVRAVPAYNKNHRRGQSVGYVISFDGLVVYHAGDTSFIPEMSSLAAAAVDYALLPTDGFWNMGGDEAGRCVDAIKPRFAIPIHSSADGLYDAKNAAKLARPQALIVAPGTSIALKKR